MENFDTHIVDQLTKKIAKGGLVFLCACIAGSGINVALNMLLTRVLGAAQYGMYALGWGIFIITSRISFLGVPTGMLKFVASYKGEGNITKMRKVCATGLSIISSNAIIISIAFFLISDFLANSIFHNSGLSLVLRIFAVALPFFNCGFAIQAIIRAFQHMRYYSFLKEILMPLLNIIVVLLAFFVGLRLDGALYAFLISVGLSLLINFHILKKVFPELFHERIYPMFDQARVLLRFSIPVFLVGLSFIILNQTSRIAIGRFRTSDEVGIYSISATITMLIVMVLDSVDSIFAPIISHLYNQKRINEIDKLFKTTTRWVFSMGLPFAIICIIFSKDVMSLFGNEFVRGYAVLIILVSASLVNVATGSVSFLLQMSGKQDVELINGLSVMLTNICLNFILVPKFGMFGAAAATAFSLSALNVARLIEVVAILRIQPYDRKFLKPLFSVVFMVVFWIAMAGVSYFHEMQWIVRAVILVTVYVAMIFILKLEREENEILAVIKKRILG